MPAGLPEFVENPENRCPVVLVLDTSGSMAGEPISQLNRGIGVFKEAVETDDQASLRVEVAIVSFGPVRLAQDFVTVHQFVPPRLTAQHDTPMGEAVSHALDLVEERKRAYRENGVQYYRPWVFLISDGAPNPGSNWEQAAWRAREADASKKVCFFAVGVQDADMKVLAQFAPPERPPVMLDGLDFHKLFQWLSASVVRVSGSQVGGQMVELPPVTWGSVST